ncbi:helix-turn-helix transcriptional regulator [Shewanella algae]|uniref:helix-turn-helix domain-containing protein n=1 Tax=Shewanella algae TaxID=38313 RepID=UPI0031F576F3
MKTPVECPFPKRLKQVRQQVGLSQRKLGIEAGMDPSVSSARMNQYEKGVHQPDFSMVHALSKVLKVPTAFFYCVEDDLAELILKWKGHQ